MSANSSNNLLSNLFKHWGALTFDKPWFFIGLCAIMLALLVSQAMKVKMDMSTEAMLHELDPARVSYDAFRERFGREDVILLTIPTGGVLSVPLLKKVAALQAQLETHTPYLNKITSLINARHTYGQDDELIVEDLLEGFPELRFSESELLEFVLAQPSYINRLISEDGQFLSIVIELDTFVIHGELGRQLLSEPENAEAVTAIKRVVEQTEQTEGVDIYLSGEPVMMTTLNAITSASTQLTSTLGGLVIIVFSYLFFRRLSGVLFPLLIVQTSIISAVGVMGYFEAPFTLTTNAVLALMLGIAVADAVHILTLFYRYHGEHGDKRKAIIDAMTHTAPAVFLTSVTTAIGFLSFLSGDLASTSDLGIYSAVAVIFALFYTITLIPSFIAIFPMKKIPVEDKVNVSLQGFLSICAHVATTYPRGVSYASLVVIVLCVWGVTFQWMSYDPVDFFPDSALEKREYYDIDKHLNGITNIEILLETNTPSGIFDRQFLDRFMASQELLENGSFAEKNLADAYSLLNILKETHKALNNNKSEFYTVANHSDLVAQEVLLFEMSEADDLYDVVDDDKSMVRLSLKTHHADGVDLEKMIRALEKELAVLFEGTAEVQLTGATVLVAESVPRAIKTMVMSFVIAIFSIIVVMIILMRSLRIGLISIIPNILPILMGINFMVILDWPLTMSTIMVGAIAMGIVVDDTLHLLYHFKENYVATGDSRKSIKLTLTSVGPALFITTVVFSFCCATNLFSDISSVFMFGSTMGVVMFSALMSDILIAPAFLIWAYDKR